MKCGPLEVNVFKSPHHRYPWVEVWRMEYASDHGLLAYWQKTLNGEGLKDSFLPWLDGVDGENMWKDFQQIMNLHPVSLLKDFGKPSDIWPDGI